MNFFRKAGQKAKSQAAAVKPPAPSEYSPEAISQEVLRTGLTHPGTLYPLALGVGCGVGGLILGWPLLYLIALGGGLVGPAWAVVQFCFLPGRIRRRYLERLDRRRAQYKEALKENLLYGLEERFSTDRAREAAAKGQCQFEGIGQILEDIKELLAMKLNPGELLYHRFLAAAEQTYLSVLDNLKDVIALLKSADSIDPEEVEDRLSRYKRKRSLSRADEEEKSALEDRKGLWEKQLCSAELMLAKNERAMTEMETISHRIAEWQTGQHFAASDIEQTIQELQQLARFAHNINGKEQA